MQLRVSPLLAHCFRRNCIAEPSNREALEGRIGLAMQDECSVTPIIDMSEPDAEDTTINLSSELTIEGLRTWVPDWQLIDSDTDPCIVEYLAERNITQADIDWLHIGWGPVLSRSGAYLNEGHPWVLFPVIKNGKLAGVQARCPSCYLKENGIKYWLHSGFRKKTVVFNLDIARQLGWGVLCEGVFDVASIGKPGVCSFGHTPSLTQKRLLAANLQGLIWLPDTDVSPTLDAIAIAQQQAAEWNAADVFPKDAHVVILPAKDAGSMTRQAVWETIMQQVSPDVQQQLLKEVVPKL